jgi:superfamily II DNA or RNA helicase
MGPDMAMAHDSKSPDLLLNLILILATSILLVGSGARADTAGVDAAACSRALTRIIKQDLKGYRSLPKKQQDFLRNTFLPVTGMRGLYLAPKMVRECRSKTNCLIFPADSREANTNRELRIEWDRSVEAPEIIPESGADVLRLPMDFDFAILPDRGASLMKQFLIADPRHPFSYSSAARDERIALGEPELFHKEVQVQASQAVVNAIDGGDKRFLFVAPTGTGKTEVLLAALRHQIINSPKKLHILTADTNTLVSQLVGDLHELSDLDFEILRWGGDESATEFAELLKYAKRSTKPVVLVSTIQSLKLDRVGALLDSNRRAINATLGTVIYDEAHHSAADQTSAFLSSLLDGTDVFLFGTTATPVHARRSVQELYGNRAFWAYLDSPESYTTRPKSVNREVTDVIEQLSRAMDAGESPHFDRVHFIEPSSLVGDNRDLFLRLGGTSLEVDGNEEVIPMYVLNPKYYGHVAKRIQGLLRQHDSGFITVATIEEANEMTAILNKMTKGKSFAAWHSKMKAEDSQKVLEDFKAGRINYLVTCKRLDEGVNVPQMTLYIDLNKSVGPRQFLQRAGRVLRVIAGKRRVDIASLTEINEANAQEMLLLLDRFLEGKLIKVLPGEDAPPPRPRGGGVIGELSDEEYRRELEKLQQTVREFWQEHGQERFRLSLEQHAVFKGEGGMLDYLNARFDGIGNNSTKLVAGLAEMLPETDRADFVNLHGDLGNREAVASALKYAGSAALIVALLQDWVQKSADYDEPELRKAKLALSIDQSLTAEAGQMLLGPIFIPSLTLDEQQHEVFKGEGGMLGYLKARFDGIGKDSTKLVADLAEMLPEGDRADFISLHGDLGSKQNVNNAKRHPGSAARIVELVQDWVQKSAEYNEPELRTVKLLLRTDQLLTAEAGQMLLGPIFIPSLTLDEQQHAVFKGEGGMLSYLKARFDGIVKDSTKLVAALAEMLPEADRAGFIGLHGDLGSRQIVNFASKYAGSAARIVELLQDWVQKSVRYDEPALKKVKLALTTDQLLSGEAGVKMFGGVRLSISEAQHAVFKGKGGMLDYLKTRFYASGNNSTKLVAGLAEMLPEEYRVDFVNLHGDLGNKTIVCAASEYRGLAARVIELLQDWAQRLAKSKKNMKQPSVDDLLLGETGRKLFGPTE